MAKTNYEAVLIFSVKEGDDVSALVEKFKTLIEANGTLTSIDEWGKRRLAYPINYETEGYYVLYNFEAEPDFPAEFERIANITDRTIRSMVVKAQAPVQVKEPVSDTDEDAADAPAEEAAE